MKTLHIHNDYNSRLSFTFNGKSADISHLSGRHTPYEDDKFASLPFELYSNQNRDSWTNELVLIMKDNVSIALQNEVPDEIKIVGIDTKKTVDTSQFQPEERALNAIEHVTPDRAKNRVSWFK